MIWGATGTLGARCALANADPRLSPRRLLATGYIVVNDVLEPDHLQALHGHIAELRAQKTAEGWGGEDEPWTMTQAVFTHAHDLGSTDAFISLLTQSKVLPKVVDILGHNIFCYHSYLVSSPPAGGRAKQPPPDFDRSPTLGFHQDSGLQRDIRASNDNSHHVMPRISLKCACESGERPRPSSLCCPFPP